MAAKQLRTFGDIVDAIREAIGVQAADTAAMNKIRRFVNLVYLDEVIPFKRWSWLTKNLQVVHNAYYNTGTAIVTPTSTTVTLSIAPSVGLGSFATHRFAIDNSNKVYTVQSHTAGSATLVLTSAYQEDLNNAANYKIWRDRVDLPVTAKETIQITHAELPTPLRAIGSQDYRKYEAANPKAEGFPGVYNTDTFYNPDGSIVDDDRYRQVRLYPAITTSPVTLSIDYIQQAVALDDDSDEPIIPVEDRAILLYLGGARAWSLLMRNEEMADKWQAYADRKLTRMAGDRDDGFDTPKIVPDSNYVNSQRKSGLRKRRLGYAFGGGESSVSLPSYLTNVTINGGTLTADLNVSPGVLIDGVDISALGSITTPVEATLDDNTTNGVVSTFELTDYDVVHIEYSLKRGTSREVGQIKLIATAATASISQGAIATIGSAIGVTFSADTSGTTLRLLYTTTSTGDDADMKFSAFKWLA